MKNIVLINKRVEGCVLSLTRSMMEVHDPYTVFHQDDAAEVAIYIAHKLKLTEIEISKISTAAYLHDIGKAAIPISILSKPAKLTEIEFSLVKCHVNIGVDMLRKIDFDSEVIRYIEEHHERLDGSGYPNQLVGDQISLAGQILAVADTVSALSAKRTYRNSKTSEQIKEILLGEIPHKLNEDAVCAAIQYLDIAVDKNPFKGKSKELV